MVKSRFLGLGLIVLFLSGCASYRVDVVGAMIPEESIKNIALGTTEEMEVYKIFGKPSKTMEFLDGSKELTYEYREEKIPVYLGGLIINEKGKRESTSTLKIIIKNGRVESYHFKKREED